MSTTGAQPAGTQPAPGAIQQQGPRGQPMSPQQYAQRFGNMGGSFWGANPTMMNPGFQPGNNLWGMLGTGGTGGGNLSSLQATPQAAAAGGQQGAQGAAGAQGGYNPLQPSYLGAPPTGQATTGRASTGIASQLSPQQIAALGPQSSINQILAGFEPQARQSTSALNNTLAAAGIVGGGAQGAQQLLQGQLASSLAPTLAQTIQNSQGMQLGAEQGNQNALNQMTGMNMGAVNQQTLANQAAQNAMTGMNVQNMMTSNLANQQAGNAAGTNLASMLQQGWSLPLQAMSGLYQAGLGGASGLAGQEAQNFAVPPQSNLLNLWGLI